jgi:fido (protein-threonine AMPylation protein)
MTISSSKLAESLEILKNLQDQGIIAIQAKDISRTHRQRLLKNGFLQEVMKGWYIPTKPDKPKGESTTWYSSYWKFCSAYLNKRFGNKWCLSPEQSISLHVGNRTVPKQLLIRSPKGNNKITLLPYETSLLDTRYVMPKSEEISTINGIRIFSLASALIYSGPKFFMQNTSDARTALSLIRDSSDILEPLLVGGHSTIAGRLAGGFRNIGYDRIANEIIKTMSAAGFDIRETNPFQEAQPIIISSRERSPYVKRLQILWQEMRPVVIKYFPVNRNNQKIDAKSYIKEMEKIYITDAYNSLSIEGYRVSSALIQRVRMGNWNPEKDDGDREHITALAARGYWQAFKLMEKSIQKIFERKNPGKVFEEDHRDWYREMFAPCVTAGILKPRDLAGYRNGPVYIRHSMHVPPNADAVRDLMPTFCDLLCEEKNAAVRIVLGHFFFVYIHPYMDGNGRIGRFLMNLMLAAGNYPWVVIPVQRRESYMHALEEASVKQNIATFTKFLASLTVTE